ncbi:hypothetical protein K435DRAFT_789073 [Dendrothele bispora CBS 962.96]|uniref:Cytochrome P450 n=1 Tax=Dendrothele bispora (strain CBS 962.96) TaxID=1314807 RepID=A0A4V4HIK3_DENBC|nr:hypothetical protein K435DRAFT_789073 [Dendrothele bispora CBS 962.96]
MPEFNGMRSGVFWVHKYKLSIALRNKHNQSMSIFKDPDVFPNTETFDPSRWIDNNGDIKDYPTLGLAGESVFINAALLLWAFRISENPKSPIDTTAFTSTANVHPLPFGANFQPRQNQEEIKKLLRGD